MHRRTAQLITVVAMACGCLTIACSDDDTTGPVDTVGSGGSGGTGGSGGGINAGAVLPCGPGELEADDGSCRAPGIASDGCGTGFVGNDDACDPILPSAACPAGQLALLGETTCRTVAPCGAAPWGDIPVDNTTVYVDAGYTGGGNDGSSTSPFTTVQQGVNAANSGAIVAIAAGSYNGSVTLDRPVRLWGRCPEMVTLSGSAQTVDVPTAGVGSELRGLSITGTGMGVRILGAADIVVDAAWVHDTGGIGIYLDDSGAAASLTVRNTLIEAVTEVAVRSYNGDVNVEDSVIRNVQPAAGSWGMGIDGLGYGSSPDMSVTLSRSIIDDVYVSGVRTSGPVQVLVEDSYITGTLPDVATGFSGQAVFGHWDSVTSDGARPTITLNRSVFADNTWLSVHTNGPDLVIDRSVVRDTQQAPDVTGGMGISLYAVEQVAGGVRPTAHITQSVIERSHINGIELNGVVATLESCVIRDVEPRANGTNGLTLTAWPSDENGDPSDVTLRGGRFERTHQGNIAVSGSNAVIDSIAVLDTAPRALDGGLGTPLAFMINPTTMAASTATVERTVVDGGYAAAVVVAGSDATFSDVLVRNILPQDSTGDFGDGIAVSAFFPLLPGLHATSAQLSRVTVDGVPRAGVSVFGTGLTLSDSFLDCNAIDLDGEPYDGQEFTLDDGGGNVCGCGQEAHECRVLSSGLLPPVSL